MAARVQRPLRRGYLVALEGIDGSGTTTQLHLVAEELTRAGYAVHTASSLSTNPIGRLIRRFLGGELALPAREEEARALMTLLFSADRIELYAREVLPELEQHKVVLYDRHVLSTIAYQTTNLNMYQWICTVASHTTMPDLSILLELDVETADLRLDARNRTREIYENRGVQRLASANYASLRNVLPESQLATVDASLSIVDVTARVCELIERLVDND